MVAETCGERLVRQLELARVDPEARQRAAGTERPEGALERLLRPQGLDRDVGAVPAGQAHDLLDDVDLGEVERDVGAHPAGHRQPDRVAVHADDLGRAHQLGAGRRAQADRALGEDDDRVADAHAAGLRAREPGRGDVGQQDDLLVGHVVRDLGQVGLGRRHEQVLGLRAVDRVAEPPAADGLEAGPVAALGQVAGEAGVALAARGDGPDQHPLAGLVPGHAGAELLDDAHRLMAEDQARADRVLALDDVDVGPADRRQRDPDQRLARTGPGPIHLLDVELLRGRGTRWPAWYRQRS